VATGHARRNHSGAAGNIDRAAHSPGMTRRYRYQRSDHRPSTAMRTAHPASGVHRRSHHSSCDLSWEKINHASQLQPCHVGDQVPPAGW